MIKYFCDGCDKEIDRPNKFEVPCHLYSFANKAYTAALEAIGKP